MNVRETMKRLEISPQQQQQIESIQQLQQAIQNLDLSRLESESIRTMSAIQNQLTETLDTMKLESTTTAKELGATYAEIISKEIAEVSLALSALTGEAKTVGSKLHGILDRAAQDLPRLLELSNSQASRIQPLVQKVSSLEKALWGVGSLLALNLVMSALIFLR